MTHLKIFIFCFCLSISTQAQESKPSPSQQLSQRLESMLAMMQESIYQHRTEIDEAAGKINCDCSGLMCYALRNDFPEAYLGLGGELAPWKSRPLAVTFYESFERAGSEGDGLWQKIPRLMDTRPGDLLAWRKRTLKKGSTTGHVCMIASKPIVDTDGMIKIRILDSTSALHENDTRRAGETGIGAGEMWFKVDENGHPIAFTIRKNSKLITSNLILVGRLQSGKPIQEVTLKEDAALIGLTEENAAKKAASKGLKWRVIERGGETFPVSLSRHNPDRLNAVVVNGLVKRIRRG